MNACSKSRQFLLSLVTYAVVAKLVQLEKSGFGKIDDKRTVLNLFERSHRVSKISMKVVCSAVLTVREDRDKARRA